MLENVMSSVAGGFDPSSNLYCSQAALMGLGGSHGNLQDHLQMRPNMFYSNCGGGVPNIILTGTDLDIRTLWRLTSSTFHKQVLFILCGVTTSNQERAVTRNCLFISLTRSAFVILSDDSNPSLSKDISSVLSAVPECLDSEGVFPLEDELRIEPLSLDGLSMLSDPDMVLPDPSVEDSFRSDRL